jgi:hypothetical protein
VEVQYEGGGETVPVREGPAPRSAGRRMMGRVESRGEGYMGAAARGV